MSADSAKARFFAIQILRISGVALVLAGIGIVHQKIDLPRELGYALVLFGLADAFIVPIILARIWKSPRS